MARTKKKLCIEKCILLAGGRRLEKGLKPIKNTRQLSIELATEEEKSNNIYFKLYRYEKDGFYNEPVNLIPRLEKLLLVTRFELVEVI
jgi:hypothetical protein